MHSEVGGRKKTPVLLPFSLYGCQHPPPPGTCCSCQPEGLKFLQLAEPMHKLGKQKGKGEAAPAEAGRPTPSLFSGSPAQS